MRGDQGTLKNYTSDVNIGFWVSITEFLHAVVKVYQFGCAIPEGNMLTKLDQKFTLLRTDEFGPQKCPQEWTMST